jgi:hypothetical protein
MDADAMDVEDPVTQHRRFSKLWHVSEPAS